MTPNGFSQRRRSRLLSTGLEPSTDEEPHSKGGHSLRRRARVDYTQEQIDEDPATYDTRSEPNTLKSASTPGPKVRRRRFIAHDVSDDNSDEPGAPQRRRRPDTSPAAPRPTPARRKSAARKPATDVKDFIEQQPSSDNDVQDTILVGVSMDELQSSDMPSSSPARSDQHSEQLSEKHSDSRPSTSGGPNAEPSHSSSLPPLIRENASPVKNQGNQEAHRPREASSGPPALIASPKLSPETTELDTSPLNSGAFHAIRIRSPSGQTLKKEPEDPETHSSLEQYHIGEGEDKLASSSRLFTPEPQPEEVRPGLDHREKSTPTPITTGENLPSSPVLHTSQDRPPTSPVVPSTEIRSASPQPAGGKGEEEAAPKVPVVIKAVSPDQSIQSTAEAGNQQQAALLPPTPSRLDPNSPAPTSLPEESPDKKTAASTPMAAMVVMADQHSQKPHSHSLPQLDRIYRPETRNQSHLQAQLSPYDDDEVHHPSPWTEMKNSEDSANSTPTPARTPAPTPPEDPFLEDMWDGQQNLTLKEFFALYRADADRRKLAGEPSISMQAFRRVCAWRKRKALENPPSPEPPAEPAAAAAPAPTAAPSLLAKKGRKGARRKAAAAAARLRRAAGTLTPNEPEAIAQSPEETPGESPAVDSARPTAANTPEPVGDEIDLADQQQEPEEEAQEPDLADEDAESDVDGDAAGKPKEVLKYPKMQYVFRRIRESSAFAEALKDYQDMDPATLFNTVAACVESLKTWQDEYKELKKITDDEENAKRRQANDKSIENWEKRLKPDDVPTWRRTYDDPCQKMPPPFDLKGVRAPRPYIDDPELERQRHQDRIMAQAYGFAHNSHSNYVGRQRPEEQRLDPDEAEHDTRLRDRKQTQKAVDAAAAAEDGVVTEGKRVRKPRVLGDRPEPSREPSRATTPIPRQRRRRTNLAIVSNSANLGDEEEEEKPQALQPAAVAAPEPAPKRRNRGRAKAKEDQDDAAAAAAATAAPPDAPVQSQQRTQTAGRKRGRATQEDPVATPTSKNSNNTEAEPPKPKRQRATRTRSGLGITTNIEPRSFYSNPSPADTDPASRPSTSSSVTTFDTAGTAESSYSLRDKKKRNFAIENDPDLEPRSSGRKRARTSTAAARDAEEDRTPKRKRTTQQKKAPAARQGANSAESYMITLPFPRASPAATNVATGPAPMMHTFNASPSVATSTAAPAPPAKKPLTKIKIINSRVGAASASQGPTRAVEQSPAPKSTAKSAGTPSAKAQSKSSKAAAPSAAASPAPSNGASADVVEKPYSEMSKSEKMSYSMRSELIQSNNFHPDTLHGVYVFPLSIPYLFFFVLLTRVPFSGRWARGEMQGAVEKRKNTLAKKAEAKTSTADTPEAATPTPTTPAIGQPKQASTGSKQKTASATVPGGSASASGSATPARLVNGGDNHTPLASPPPASAAMTANTPTPFHAGNGGF